VFFTSKNKKFKKPNIFRKKKHQKTKIQQNQRFQPQKSPFRVRKITLSGDRKKKDLF